ncbi:MAG: serine hydrolase, partial [Lentisphaerae bacterium]|nr:serine hydrolase [Lentisphaerota bacterium]
LSKSFTSTAVGLAISEGRFKISDPVIGFFPKERLPGEISEELKSMTIRHLLTMTSGHGQCALEGVRKNNFQGDWVKQILAEPLVHKPGTHFVYNSGATYLLSAILNSATGENLLDYLSPRIFDPLGITGVNTETSPDGTHVGGWGMSMKTEDIAKFGQLYLQKGRWGERQLIPESWVREATSFQVPNSHAGQLDWAEGYGYQFWRCRHNAFRGDGAFGQYCLVMPDQDAVIAITAGLQNMQQVLDLAWEELLPNMQTGRLPVSKAAKYVRPCMPKASGAPSSPLASQINGRSWKLTENPGLFGQALFCFDRTGVTLELGAAEMTETLTAGYGDWRYGQIRLENDPPRRYAASAGWVAPEKLQIFICCYEQPFNIVLECIFGQEKLTMEMKFNVTFWSSSWSTIHGEMEI